MRSNRFARRSGGARSSARRASSRPVGALERRGPSAPPGAAPASAACSRAQTGLSATISPSGHRLAQPFEQERAPRDRRRADRSGPRMSLADTRQEVRALASQLLEQTVRVAGRASTPIIRRRRVGKRTDQVLVSAAEPRSKRKSAGAPLADHPRHPLDQVADSACRAAAAAAKFDRSAETARAPAPSAGPADARPAR